MVGLSQAADITLPAAHTRECVCPWHGVIGWQESADGVVFYQTAAEPTISVVATGIDGREIVRGPYCLLCLGDWMEKSLPKLQWRLKSRNSDGSISVEQQCG